MTPRNTHEPEETLEGEIERISFSNDATGFTVAQVVPRRGGPLETVVGDLGGAMPGELLVMRGRWAHHAKFGRQFEVRGVPERIPPATEKGIRRFLSSGLIPGIGPVMADRILKKFGTGALDVLEREPERLREVPGIGEKRVQSVRGSWEEFRGVRDILIFLHGYGISRSLALKIYRKYGANTFTLVKENPYRLANEIVGVGFKTADRIAGEAGIEKTSPHRLEAGVVFTLSTMTEEGHTCVPWNELTDRAARLLEVDRDSAVRGASQAFEKKELVLEDVNESLQDFDADRKMVYLPALLASENGIARRLAVLRSGPRPAPKPGDVEAAVREIENEQGVKLTAEQVSAVQASVDSKILILTGGPGTGKTTITRAIVKLAERRRESLLLMAPTGRASRRLAEATRTPAKTIHRGLEFQPRGFRFMRDEENPVTADLVIVDEASMIDTYLMYQLLKAIPKESRLVLVGDVDQLPSVGPGNVLRDLIGSGIFPVVRLGEIFRQDHLGFIVKNAHRVLRGEMPCASPPIAEGLSDYYLFTVSSPDRAAREIVTLIQDKIPSLFGMDPRSQIQCICPMYKGEAGADNLNRLLQQALNPDGAVLGVDSRGFRVGDKVMQIRNNYDLDVFNGDIGTIEGLDPQTGEVRVRFDSEVARYSAGNLEELVLAYAITVHKSQGGEYPAVVMPVLTQHFKLLERNLLYTAITRARRLMVLVGTEKAVRIAIANNEVQKRYTGLRRKIAALGTI